MKKHWFRPVGLLYRPVHSLRYAVTLLSILFLMPVCMAIIRNGHSVSDDLYHLFVYTTCSAFWWRWIAEKTSTQ